MPPKTVPLVLGIFLLIGAALFLLATTGFLVGTSTTPPDPGLAAVSGTCTAIFAIPGVLLLVVYRRAARRDERTAALAAILQNMREVAIADVARTLQETPAETIVLMSEAIAAGRVHGYIDSQSGKFVAWQWGSMPPPVPPPTGPPQPAASHSAPAPPGPPPVPTPTPVPTEPRFCRECGSALERVPGQTAYQCPNCGHIEPG